MFRGSEKAYRKCLASARVSTLSTSNQDLNVVLSNVIGDVVAGATKEIDVSIRIVQYLK